jgi:hypothetical protein
VTIGEHIDTLEGRPVRDFDPERGVEDPTGTLYRLSLSWERSKEKESLTDILAQFLDDPRAGQVSGIVIGMWEDPFESAVGSDRIVAALVAARQRLPSLKAIFLGDITYEECEISWINQTDVSPLLDAYPELEYFRVRGGQGLVLGWPHHEALRTLIIESGGLPPEVVRAVGGAHLPRLEHLELWLGSAEYGGTTTVADLEPILNGRHFPNLRYLGLRDCEIADDLTVALAEAPILQQIKVLDLSLGNLSDEGARSLLENPAIAALEKLDIHHHYVSPALLNELAALGIVLDASDPKESDEYGGEFHRYIAVSE